MTSHVLLIQADPTGAAVVRDALCDAGAEPSTLEWVRSCSDGLDRLARIRSGSDAADSIAAVVVDFALPDGSGLRTLDRIRAVAPTVPVLVLCGALGEHEAHAAVRRGAQDYLLRTDVNSRSLPEALRGIIEGAAIANGRATDQERAQLTLNSIGDAVVSTDLAGNVTYINSVAERLTGWSRAEAVGRPFADVFTIVDGSTREIVENPMPRAILENGSIALAPNSTLISRAGVDTAIEDSVSPIRDARGAVRGAVMVFRDVSAARAHVEHLAHLVQHDSLTELPNRLLLNDRLRQAVALARRERRQVALLFVDVDHFKAVNDSLGHAVGDRLLQSVALRLLDCVRSSDTVSRLGGDEFVILLPEIGQAQDAAVAAETILRAFDASHRIDQHHVRVSVSIGIATYPSDGADPDTLLKRADVAMYRAKAEGRNTARLFTDGSDLDRLAPGTSGSPAAGAADDTVLSITERLDLQVVADGVDAAGQLTILRELSGAEALDLFFSHPVEADGMTASSLRAQSERVA